MGQQKTMADFFGKAPQTTKKNRRAVSEEAPGQQNKKPKVDANAAVASKHAEPTNEAAKDRDAHLATDDKVVAIADGTTDCLEDAIGETWLRVLSAEFEKSYFKTLKTYLAAEKAAKKKVYPPANQIYEWTRVCTFDDIKVVILGQDPYHRKGQAHGLSFSVIPGVKIPPSLVNIYKELTTDIAGFMAPNHGYLNNWAKQGVLLLNACLTVREGEANAHAKKGWEQFTDAVIKQINERKKNVVFLLWGSYAQKKGAVIDQKNHCVIKTVHPSPLSAHRGFLGSKCFSQCNDYLTASNQTPIDWKAVSS